MIWQVTRKYALAPLDYRYCSLCDAATPTSTINFDHIVSRFGLVLATESLKEEQFHKTLAELAYPNALPPAVVADAVEWAKSRGGLTVRNAAMYLRKSEA